MNKHVPFCFLICFFPTAFLIAGRVDEVVNLCRRQRWRENTFSIKNGCLYQNKDDSEESKCVMGTEDFQEVVRFDAYKTCIIGLIMQKKDRINAKLHTLCFEIKSMESEDLEKVEIESEVTKIGPFTMSVDGTEIVSLEKRLSVKSTELVTRKKTEQGWEVKKRKSFTQISCNDLENYKALGCFPMQNEIHLIRNDDKAEVMEMPH